MKTKFGVWIAVGQTAKDARVIEARTPQVAALDYYAAMESELQVRLSVLDPHGTLRHFDCTTERVPLLGAREISVAP